MTGKFITFEGPDGAGKSSQMRRLGKVLTGKGFEVVFTREPGGTSISEEIREILLDPSNIAMTNKTEALLYAAARAQHVEELIIPALQAGNVVISDRFVDSTLAYQGYGRGIDLNMLSTVNALALGNLKPDITIILDLSPALGLSRIKDKRLKGAAKNGDRIEMESLEFHQRVRQGFLEIARQNPSRYKIVSAADDEDTVFDTIITHVNEVL